MIATTSVRRQDPVKPAGPRPSKAREGLALQVRRGRLDRRLLGSLATLSPRDPDCGSSDLDLLGRESVPGRAVPHDVAIGLEDREQRERKARERRARLAPDVPDVIRDCPRVQDEDLRILAEENRPKASWLAGLRVRLRGFPGAAAALEAYVSARFHEPVPTSDAERRVREIAGDSAFELLRGRQEDNRVVVSMVRQHQGLEGIRKLSAISAEISLALLSSKVCFPTGGSRIARSAHVATSALNAISAALEAFSRLPEDGSRTAEVLHEAARAAKLLAEAAALLRDAGSLTQVGGPDRVRVVLATASDAVKAAREILDGLPAEVLGGLGRSGGAMNHAP
jgi:hypothetical protein